MIFPQEEQTHPFIFTSIAPVCWDNLLENFLGKIWEHHDNTPKSVNKKPTSKRDYHSWQKLDRGSL